MTPIILIKATQVYDGILRFEARESTESEILPLVDSGFDFKGSQYRIVVLPIHCTITAEEALAVATDWAKKQWASQVDFRQYSKMQASLQGSLKRNQQYHRKKYKSATKKKRDRHHLDLSSESE
jgi:hypothetical protein